MHGFVVSECTIPGGAPQGHPAGPITVTYTESSNIVNVDTSCEPDGWMVSLPCLNLLVL